MLLHLPGRRVRRLQPEVHAPVLRGLLPARAASGCTAPATRACSTHGPASRPPARRSGGCRGSCCVATARCSSPWRRCRELDAYPGAIGSGLPRRRAIPGTARRSGPRRYGPACRAPIGSPARATDSTGGCSGDDRSPPGELAVVMAALMIGLLLMGIQLWLLTVALELYLGGQRATGLAAGAGVRARSSSAAC